MVKIRDEIVKFFKENIKYLVLFIVLILLFTIELPYKVYAPGGMVELSKRVNVENGYATNGTLGMAYVSMIKGSIPYLLLSYVIPDWDIVSDTEIKYDNETMKERIEADKISTEQSISSAIIASYTLAGKSVQVNEEVVHITYIDEQANTDLKVLDIVKSVEGQKIKNTKELKELLKNYRPGDKVTFQVLRSGKEIECTAALYDSSDGAKVGVMLTETYDIEETPNCSITMKQSESGPSGGLMMSLQIYNDLTEEDITKGKKIIGTGTIDNEGNVGAIGGVKYKLIGAARKHADIFLVPTDNYEEAISVKESHHINIDIIAVGTLKEAINSLENN